MNTWTTAVLATAGTAVLSAGLTLLAIPLLQHWEIVDQPNARSSHDRPVLRGGGMAPAAAIVVTSGVVSGLAVSSAGSKVLACWAASVLAFALLGFIEDVRGIGVLARAVAQLAPSSVAVASLAQAFGSAVWMALPALVVVAAFVNAANFMDGLNGLSGLFGLVSGLSYAGLGWIAGREWLVVAGVILAIAFAAFLPWNVVSPRLFLGDVGSYALGAALGVAGVGAVLDGVPLPAVAAPVLVYIVDTGYTLLIRIRRGERWYEAHRSHAYQRLNQAGWSHVGVAAFVAAVSALCGLAGLAWLVGGVGLRVLSGLVVVLLMSGYLVSPNLVLRRRVSRGRTAHQQSQGHLA